MTATPETVNRRPVRRRQHDAGQVIVLFALAAIVVLGMVAIAIDGGYGLVQQRRAQNAADFAAVAGTRVVRTSCEGQANPPSNQAVYVTIQSVIDQNSQSTGANWTGVYLDRNGAVIKDSGGNPVAITNNSAVAPPPTACGVSVTVTPTWRPYIAQLIGFNSLKSTASAKSVLNPAAGKNIGIVSLDQVSPHDVLGGGTGSFNVYGTIFANSAVPYNPWGQNQIYHNVDYVDIVDAKDDSNLILHGIMETVSQNWPLDWCFGNNSPADAYNKTPTTSPPNPDPYNTAICSGGSGSGKVTLKYDQIVNGQSQITDPLLPPPSGAGGLPDPFDPDNARGGLNRGLCPGQNSPTVFPSPGHPIPTPDVNGILTLQPGDYQVTMLEYQVSVRFADCSGAFQPDPTSTSNYPGVFRFEKGLLLLPGAGQSVVGNNVMIATGSPVPIPSNVPGSFNGNTFVPSGVGNGAPCFPTGVITTQGKAETDTSLHRCGGTDPTAPAPYGTFFANGPYSGVISYNQSTYNQDTNAYGTGTNFSLIIGGKGATTLSAPTTGVYRDVALFQNRSVQGNFGLDAEPGDSASITIGGVVYDASLPCYGYPVANDGTCTNNATKPSTNPFDYWDTGIVFHSGGVLQAGIGSGQLPFGSTGSYPNPSHGAVTINGPTVVDDFNTDGATSITIDGTKNQYDLPGVLGSGNPPVTG